MLKFNAGPGEIGFLAMLQTLPFLLFSIPLGLLADRRSRRLLMVLAESLRAMTLLGLLLVTAFDLVSLPVLCTLGFLGALGTVGFSVAAPSLVPALVPRESLGLANGRLELARSLAYAGGPALAGAWSAGPAPRPPLCWRRSCPVLLSCFWQALLSPRGRARSRVTPGMICGKGPGW